MDHVDRVDRFCVLVVEDDRGTRQVTRELLQDEGYTVAEANSAEGAIRFLESNRAPLVILLDFSLPPANATPVLQYLAAHPPIAAHCAIITFPASPKQLTSEYTALAEGLGAPLIAKPFDLDTLLATVAEQATALHRREGGP